MERKQSSVVVFGSPDHQTLLISPCWSCIWHKEISMRVTSIEEIERETAEADSNG